MISYEPLWKTMKEKGATTYTLQYKGGEHNISSSTIRRLKAGESVSTNTLDSPVSYTHLGKPQAVFDLGEIEVQLR